jgi:hypothetical protein
VKKRRGDMVPGDIFVVTSRSHWRGFSVEWSAVLVVTGRKTEVDFWRGGSWVVGDVAPGKEYELLAASPLTKGQS